MKQDGSSETIAKEATSRTVCGRIVGTATGWDEVDMLVLQLYGLSAAAGYEGPTGDCVRFDFDRGLIETCDGGGAVTASVDLVSAIQNCVVDRTK